MVDYKQKESFLTNEKKGEIIFSNHKLEFLRFFDRHKRLCDEIAGLKHHTITNINGTQTIVIDKTNFIYGINNLNSFITDFEHYIYDIPQSKEVRIRLERLEEVYNNDEQYHKLIEGAKSLSQTRQASFNIKYLSYLKEAFEITFLMSKYLQKNLNISSREISKNIQYVDYDGFFNNLSVYKEEVANEIAGLKYVTIYDNYKKIMGFFYTYRYLITLREQKHILDLLKLVFDYITNDETIKYILRLKEGGEITRTNKETMIKEFMIIKRSFNKINLLCNRSLMNKNILPKTQTDVLIDTTLI